MIDLAWSLQGNIFGVFGGQIANEIYCAIKVNFLQPNCSKCCNILQYYAQIVNFYFVQNLWAGIYIYIHSFELKLICELFPYFILEKSHFTDGMLLYKVVVRKKKQFIFYSFPSVNI